MPLLGQASGGWTESSSALRLLNLGIRNSVGVLTDDAFTQNNPVGTANYPTAKVDVTKHGVLSGSVCFVRADGGSNYVGGPGDSTVKAAIAADPTMIHGYRPLGVFINSALGNAYENTPGVASGVGPYISGMGTYGNALYETYALALLAGGGHNVSAGAALTYYPGVELITSLNGFLMPLWTLSDDGVECRTSDIATVAAEYAVRGAASTVIGIIKMVPDSVQTELVYDQRI